MAYDKIWHRTWLVLRLLVGVQWEVIKQWWISIRQHVYSDLLDIQQAAQFTLHMISLQTIDPTPHSGLRRCQRNIKYSISNYMSFCSFHWFHFYKKQFWDNKTKMYNHYYYAFLVTFSHYLWLQTQRKIKIKVKKIIVCKKCGRV